MLVMEVGEIDWHTAGASNLREPASAAAGVAIASYAGREQSVEVARVTERVAYPSTTPFREQILAVEKARAVLAVHHSVPG